MSGEPRITAVGAARASGPAHVGDDRHFVRVAAGSVHGAYGPVGEATAELVSAALAPLAVGAPVSDHGGLLARIIGSFAAPATPAMSWAVGALDCAVWDLHGRVAGEPVADLLAGRSVSREIPAYASWLRLDITKPATAEIITRVAGGGWQFTKWGARRRAGTSTGEEAARWVAAAHRAADAAGAPVALDALGTWDPALTDAFADSVEPRHLHWLEDPQAGFDVAHGRREQAMTVPLAVGERLGLGDDPSLVLAGDGLMALTIDVVGCGGLTLACGIVTEARRRGVPVYPHGRSFVPGAHLAAAYPQAAPAVEYRVQWEPRRQATYQNPMVVQAGQVQLPDRPGLGVILRSR